MLSPCADGLSGFRVRSWVSGSCGMTPIVSLLKCCTTDRTLGSKRKTHCVRVCVCVCVCVCASAKIEEFAVATGPCRFCPAISPNWFSVTTWAKWLDFRKNCSVQPIPPVSTKSEDLVTVETFSGHFCVMCPLSPQSGLAIGSGAH